MHETRTSDDAFDRGLEPVTKLRTPRPARRHVVASASPDAVDVVFANLARLDVLRRADGRSCSRPHRAAQAQDAKFDNDHFRGDHLHELALEMDRQHERLAQLLRDIDGPVAPE